MFAPLGFVPGITPAQAEAVAKRGGWDAAGVPTLDHFKKLGAWLAGTPDDLVARLEPLEERYHGMVHHNPSTSMGPPTPDMLAPVQWVGAGVRPHLGPGGKNE